MLHSEEDTARLARTLARVLRFGETVGLKGDLGAGKTTLVRYLVEELGGSANHVASPSFTLQNEYVLATGSRIEHWDLYRLREAPEDLAEPPARETLRVIEWPERAPLVMEELQLLLEISVGERNERIVHYSGSRAAQVERAVESLFLRE